MSILKSIKSWGWVMLLPLLLGGCTTSDDVQAIFTGKTWKMTYISTDNGQGWYNFSDLTPADYEVWTPKTGSKSFTISFTGSENDHVISGTFTGSGSVSASGKWNANGESQKFGAKVESSNVTAGGKIGAKIIEILKTADKYSGDEDNLFIYCTYERDRIFMAFKPIKE